MGKLNLIILDQDIRYLEGIKNYFSENYSEEFTIATFNNFESMKERMMTLSKKNILLVNEGLYEEEIRQLGIDAVVILSEGRYKDRKYPYPVINKFQIGSSIHKEIVKEYNAQVMDKVEKVNEKENNINTKLITIYSPIGGSGKSLLATGLAMNLSIKGAKVLYVNFEDVQSTSIYFSGSKKRDFSELIYYVKERDENFKEKFIDIVDCDLRTKVDFFNETESALDIEDMTRDDMKWMIESLLRLNIYNYIVFDTSSKFNSIYNLLINLSHHIICPILKEKTSLEKVGKFVDSLIQFNRFLFVYNKSPQDIKVEVPKSIRQGGKDIFIDIPKDFKIYLNEGPIITDSPVICNGIMKIINTLGL